ncbi:precorrin-6A/cobalt-precorrin-6A reductase [Devosia lucknowensis]|uniref:Precorrin-6A/cobalt-precorrin-6A reductase n=1 Tax=Devosia lucknowensis TaxID=1096929 RepID=A0A1Y6EGX4_9HYPH|nr:cobalt-precorrin-6A reductase [Devosia lucknowensis]SMQ59393.1 precorrin-6A/cobalt-precorrin-6A reductase [Devosia lucknowensis]
MKILILGGTAEARQLANRLVATGHDVITSLAGRTQDPILPEGGLRMGPFGGIPGLCAYLRAAQIDRLVDATHPYAGLISINAVAAATATGIPLVRYMRPAWVPAPGQTWVHVDAVQEAAAVLPAGADVLLTTGHTGLDTFLDRDDCHIHVRVIERPDLPLPDHAELIVSRPPYTVDGEMALMRRHGITHVVSKNSGGAQTAAKLEAAQNMGVTVIMIGRPVYGPALEVASVDAAIAALNGAATES